MGGIDIGFFLKILSAIYFISYRIAKTVKRYSKNFYKCLIEEQPILKKIEESEANFVWECVENYIASKLYLVCFPKKPTFKDLEFQRKLQVY